MPGNNPRILILTHCFPAKRSDIPGNFLADLTKELSSKGASVTVMTQKMNSEPDAEFLSGSGAEIKYFGWMGGKERFAGIRLYSPKDIISVISLILKGRKSFKRLIKKIKPDLVLNCWIIPSGLWSLSPKKKNNFAVWALGSDISIYGKKPMIRPVIKYILSRSGFIYTNSMAIQRDINGIFGIKSSLLYTSRKLPSTDKIYQKSKITNFIFIGRLEKIKGPDLLLNALLQSGIRNYSLKIIGEGSMQTELRDFVRSNNMEDKIKFLGNRDAHSIAGHLTVSDYLVISSLKESMPVVFWEAMQTSTPVLSTDVGDIKKYCDEFNVGRVCDTDIRSLSELLYFAHNFTSLRDVLSKNTSKPGKMADITRSAKILFDIACNKDHNV
ncbi:MAG: glycosyltransferase [Candidatus Delongbacteria bacterium]